MDKRYKNRTLKDARWYLESVHGVKSVKTLATNVTIREVIETNASEGYVLDCLLVEALNKYNLKGI